METNTKYPRTYHFPWSPGATSDDKKLDIQWFKNNNWAGSEIVITEKLDGENSCLTHTDVYSRSHTTPTRSPWSLNLWTKQGGLIWKTSDKIGVNELVYGENLYGEHSIHYDKLSDYFFIFAVRLIEEYDYWYSWDDVEFMSHILGVPTVPVLWRGTIESEEQLKKLIEQQMSLPSTFGKEKEGVVVRKVMDFSNEDFSKNVCKFVRPNHVQTDEHWTRNWKKAELNETL